MDKFEIMDLLLEKYIRNPKTRAIQNGIPRYITSDNKTCPLGAVLIDPILGNTFGDVYALVSMSLECIPGVSCRHVSFLPKGIIHSYYDGHQMNFWSDLIRFHDTDVFFSDHGLSEHGRSFLTFLHTKWEKLKYPK